MNAIGVPPNGGTPAVAAIVPLPTMPLQLRPGLYHRQIGGDHIFFDLSADRYFLLPPHLRAAFDSYLNGTPSAPALSELLAAGLIGSGQAEDSPTPLAFTHAVESLVDGTLGAASTPQILWAIWMQGRARAELRRDGILDIVARLERDRPRMGTGAQSSEWPDGMIYARNRATDFMRRLFQDCNMHKRCRRD